MLLLILMLIRSTSITSVPIMTGCFKLWYCFWYFYLSTIIPFTTKSSMTNIILKRSTYYLDTLDDSAGDNNDYDTSIVMLLWPYRPIFFNQLLVVVMLLWPSRSIITGCDILTIHLVWSVIDPSLVLYYIWWCWYCYFYWSVNNDIIISVSHYGPSHDDY